MRKDSTVVFYDEGDDMHPGIIGAYTNACTIYSTLTKKSPMNAYYPSHIPKNTGILIQQTVANVVLDSLSAWNIELINYNK